MKINKYVVKATGRRIEVAIWHGLDDLDELRKFILEHDVEYKLELNCFPRPQARVQNRDLPWIFEDFDKKRAVAFVANASRVYWFEIKAADMSNKITEKPCLIVQQFKLIDNGTVQEIEEILKTGCKEQFDFYLIVRKGLRAPVVFPENGVSFVDGVLFSFPAANLRDHFIIDKYA
ncbi:MAG: hypothetical protein WC422_02970 [Candidatus Paceibacterota bacterium]|jgi:hypothetical protein